MPTPPHLSVRRTSRRLRARRRGVLLACLAAAVTLAPGPAEPPLQAVVVVTAGWDAVEATLQRFERASPAAPWTPVGAPVAAVVGRSGLGWGLGRHAEAGEGPVKREGDGRAPAGVFSLSAAFGYAPPSDAAWIRLPYRQATRTLQCVDDAGSPFYNRLVDTTEVAVSWRSHEEMRRRDDLYRWGVVVDHNADPPRPGGGSCIFLHLWSGPAEGTSGCTAWSADGVEAVLRWLDPAQHPVLVQLPRAAYERHRRAWDLP